MVLVQWVFNLVYAVLITRVVLTFIMPLIGDRPPPVLLNINAVVNQITEPILAPIRRFTTFGALDFSPLVVILVLSLIQRALVR